MRRACVKIGDELQRRPDTLGVRADREGFIAKIFVDVPHTLGAPFGGRAEQAGAPILQSERRQPARCEEPVPLSDGGVEALEYDSAPRDAVRNVSAKHARVEATQTDDAVVAAQQLPHERAQLANCPFAGRFQRAPESAA
jgi:hypothetical protein